MKISIVYLTYRPGGYDILLDSLLRQTFKDYELIVVDDYVSPDPECRALKRRGLVELAFTFRRNPIPIGYFCRSKDKSFDTAYNLINAYNTGVLMSQGDIILIVNDYMWFPPSTLEYVASLKEMKERTAVSAVVKIYKGPPPQSLRYPYISIWHEDWSGDPQENNLELEEVWTPGEFELAFSAIPYDLLVDTNGFPECYDNEAANQVDPFIRSVREVGGNVKIDENLVVSKINHRGWGREEERGLWLHSLKKPEGSTVFTQRPNPFNLRTHKRGTLP